MKTQDETQSMCDDLQQGICIFLVGVLIGMIYIYYF